MNVQRETELLNPNMEECLRLHKCWPWFLCLGVILILVGALAVGSSYVATLATLLVFGSLLLVGGVVQIVNAFLALNLRGFFLHLVGGILHLILGGLMIDQPHRAAEVLTLMLAAVFLVSGSFRIVGAVTTRTSGWLWVTLNGVVTFALGIVIWRRWLDASYFVIGLFVGLDMIFNGWSWVMLGLIVKGAVPSSRPSTSPGQ